MLQLGIGELEISDEVIKGLEHLLHGQSDQCPVLNTQTIQVSGGSRQKEKNSITHLTLLAISQILSFIAKDTTTGKLNRLEERQ